MVLRALQRQTDTDFEVVIADDGSTDATAHVLCTEFGFTTDEFGVPGPPTRIGATDVTWLRLAHGGKARALNSAILQTDADLVLTVDADTQLDEKAVGVVRDAFARERELVGVTGIITPRSRPTPIGRALQFFQTYEYIRNFLGRYAWMRMDCLQLISGGGPSSLSAVSTISAWLRTTSWYTGSTVTPANTILTGDFAYSALRRHKPKRPARSQRCCVSGAGGSADSSRPSGGTAPWWVIPKWAAWGP